MLTDSEDSFAFSVSIGFAVSIGSVATTGVLAVTADSSVFTVESVFSASDYWETLPTSSQADKANISNNAVLNVIIFFISFPR